MTTPLDLDELPEGILHEEIARRVRARAEGCCDYCGRPFESRPPCRFALRHQRCGDRSKSARGVADGKICEKELGHGGLFHQGEGAMWSTDKQRAATDCQHGFASVADCSCAEDDAYRAKRRAGR